MIILNNLSLILEVLCEQMMTGIFIKNEKKEHSEQTIVLEVLREQIMANRSNNRTKSEQLNPFATTTTTKTKK